LERETTFSIVLFCLFFAPMTNLVKIIHKKYKDNLLIDFSERIFFANYYFDVVCKAIIREMNMKRKRYF